MKAPKSLFDLVRMPPGTADFRREYDSFWSQLKQSRAFYIAGFPEIADINPAMDEHSLWGYREQGRDLLGSWLGDLPEGSFGAIGKDQPGFALRSEPLQLDHACTLIRAAEALKKKRDGQHDIYESIRIEACVYCIRFEGVDFSSVPGDARTAFRMEVTRYLNIRNLVELEHIEADMAEGYGVTFELIQAARTHLGPHLKSFSTDMIRRGAKGNAKGASLNLRFLPGGPKVKFPESGFIPGPPENGRSERKIRKKVARRARPQTMLGDRLSDGKKTAT